MADKPDKSEIQHWFSNRVAAHFVDELTSRFRQLPRSYRHKTLEDAAAYAGQMEVLEWIAKFREG